MAHKDVAMFQNHDRRILVYEQEMDEKGRYKNTKVNIVVGAEDITMSFYDFRMLTTMMKNVVELIDGS